jgi:hypothetical protein
MSEETTYEDKLSQEEMVSDLHEHLLSSEEEESKSTGLIVLLSILSTIVNLAPAGLIYFVIKYKTIFDPISMLLIAAIWLIVAHVIAKQLKYHPKANIFDLSTSLMNLIAIGYILYTTGLYGKIDVLNTINRLESTPTTSLVELFFFQVSIILVILASILDTFYIGFYINWKENKMYQQIWDQFVDEENAEHSLELSRLQEKHEKELEEKDLIIQQHLDENIELGEQLEIAQVNLRQKTKRLDNLSQK